MSAPYSGFCRDASWAAPPLIRGDWRDLSPGESATLLIRFSTLAKSPAEKRLFLRNWPMRVRALRTSFYPAWILAEVQAAHADGRVGLCDFLYGPLGGVLVDGTSTAIHWLNGEGALRLGEDVAAAADYLRFFCSAVHGDEGRFQVVESPEDLRIRTGTEPSSSLQAGYDTRVGPLAVTRRSGGFTAKASVLYGPALFHAVFNIEATGLIEMSDDTPVASLQLAPEEFRSPFRLVGVSPSSEPPGDFRGDSRDAER